MNLLITPVLDISPIYRQKIDKIGWRISRPDFPQILIVVFTDAENAFQQITPTVAGSGRGRFSETLFGEGVGMGWCTGNLLNYNPSRRYFLLVILWGRRE